MLDAQTGIEIQREVREWNGYYEGELEHSTGRGSMATVVPSQWRCLKSEGARIY
jgi:hypothetical protein